MLFTILSVFVLQFLSAQGEFGIFFEDVDYPVYNKEYLTEPDFYIDTNNELVINISVIKQLPEGLEGHFVIMRASMGNYVVNTGIDVTMDICESIEEPIMVGPIFQALGFTRDNCPPDVGVYQCEGYKLPRDTLPDDFPPNNYKVILAISKEKQELITLEIFVKVD